MISSAFIDRPRLAIVISVVISLAGLLALSRISVAQLPDIVPPQVQVSAAYPGASAAVLEATVAQPIESKIIGVDKMIYMKSSSGNDGTYNLTVSFELGTDPDTDTVNVNNRVQTALSSLPQEVQLQGLTVQKRSSSVLQFIMFSSEGGKLDPLFITNYVLINVLDELSRTPGVGQASLFGRLNYSMRIWFDTARLTSLDLTPSDVIRAVQAQNVQAPVGRIGAQPVPKDQQFQLNVQTQGRLTTPEQFGNIVIRSNPDGSVLRVKDVARIELGAQNEDVESRLNGQSAVAVGIYLAPGANAIQVASAVNTALDKVRSRFPAGLQASVVFDSTVFINDTIHEVVKALLEAFILVIIVVFLFLGSFRATIIPVIAVPVSLVGSFAVLLVLGYSMNTVSLLAMVLAVGIVVDDAIVVVENVERVMGEEPNLSPAEVTKKSNERGHGADRGDHLGPALRIRADRLHPRNFRRAISPVRGDDQRGDGDFGHQRADAIAGAVRGVSPPFRTSARHYGICRPWNRSRSRRLCGGGAPALACVHPRPRSGRVLRGRHRGADAGDTHGLSSRGGPGLLLRQHSATGRCLAQSHQRRRPPGRRHPQVFTPGAGHDFDHWVFDT
jgi:hydrophobe/amphiphile efflux-1 (HAE1) family protein